MTEEQIIGIDLGGTNIKGVLVDPPGKIREEMTIQTGDDARNPDGQVWKKHIKEIVETLSERAAGKIERIGLSAPGLSDRDNRSIAHMPGRLAGLEKYDLGKFLGIETRVINDAQAHLVAESRFGSGKGYNNTVLLTLGTGVGGAILIDGKLYSGEIGRAGHIGHISVNQSVLTGITGTPGSLENAIGECTIMERTKGKYNSTKELVNAYKSGNSFASWIWLHSLEQLARGIVSIVNVLSPQLIILGGGITEAGESLLKPLDEFIEIYEWRPGGFQTEIKLASMGRFSGALGAAIFAMISKLEK